MGERKLTAAQVYMLTRARDGGGVFVAYGPSVVTQWSLRERGLLSDIRDALGYYTITADGLTALSTQSTPDRSGE